MTRARSALLAALLLPAAAAAQEATRGLRVRHEAPAWVGSFGEEQGRLAELADSTQPSRGLIRPLRLVRADSGQGPVLAVFHPQLRATWNSAVPFGMNDGAMWAGRGFSSMLEAGAELRWRVVTARLAPALTWSENADFPLASLRFAAVNASPFADQWWSDRIDMPQRFGTRALTRMTPGQSVLRLDWRGAAAGFGTESMWWGPGIDNAMLMTDNAEGFPHAFLGTSRPVNVWIGRLEAMYVGGRLYDSDWFRTVPDTTRNRRWMAGMVVVLEPRGAPGLSLGFGRVFYEYVPPGGIGMHEVLRVFEPFQKKKFETPTNPNGDDATDQMLSLFGRWVFPAVGFEVYAEWGKNDHARDTRDFILEPDHAAAYLAGFQKAFPRPVGGWLSLRGEMTGLACDRTIELRACPSWYAHHIVKQGYTERGQVIGAGIGPGSDMQKLVADWHEPRWTAGVVVERIRWDVDAFYRYYSPQGTGPANHRKHDVTLAGGVHGTFDTRHARLHLELLNGDERDRYSVERYDVHNLHLELRTELRP